MIFVFCRSCPCQGLRILKITITMFCVAKSYLRSRIWSRTWSLDSFIHFSLLPGLTLHHVLFCWTATQLTNKVLIEGNLSKSVICKKMDGFPFAHYKHGLFWLEVKFLVWQIWVIKSGRLFCHMTLPQNFVGRVQNQNKR